MTHDDSNEDKEGARPGPDPERLKLDEDDWTAAVRKVLKGEKPSEDDASGAQAEEGEDE